MPFAWTVAALGSSNRQGLKLPITKSDSVAVGLWLERVSARKFEKHPPRPRALKFTPSSRNSPGAGPLLWLLSVKDHGTVIAALLTIAKVLLGGVGTATRLPVASLPVPPRIVASWSESAAIPRLKRLGLSAAVGATVS